MSPEYREPGRACISPHVHVVGRSTRPSTVNVQRSVVIRGVASACRTGQSAPASYCPGGSRGPRTGRFRPRNPLVVGGMLLLGEGRTALCRPEQVGGRVRRPPAVLPASLEPPPHRLPRTRPARPIRTA